MNIQAISYAQRPAFKGIEQKDDPNKKNVFINGAGGRIGKQAFRQHLLANHTPEGVNNSWDTYHNLYAKQNLVGANMGSMGLKTKKIKDENGNEKVVPETINDVDDKALLNVFRHDSVMGDLPDCVKTSIERKDGEVFLKVSSDYGEDETFALTATRDKEEMSKMKKYDIDILKDCTGNKDALTKEGLQSLRDAVGAEVGLLSAPSKEKDKSKPAIQMVVPGVNSEKTEKALKDDGVLSAASCTTTCVTPIAKVLEDKFGIDVANLETVHAVTATQPTEDRSKSKAASKDRASGQFIPTTTGAAKAAGKVIPSLKGVMDGQATRGPVMDGSMIVLNAYTTNKDVTEESVLKVLKDASENEYKGMIAFADEASASNDVVGRTENALIIPESIKVTTGKSGNKLITVKAYYDNETGYTRSYSGSLGNETAEYLLKQDKA